MEDDLVLFAYHDMSVVALHDAVGGSDGYLFGLLRVFSCEVTHRCWQ